VRRLTIVALIAAFASAAFQPAGASAQTAQRRRVVVVLLDGSDIASWIGRPALAQLLDASGAALLSTRTGRDETDDESQRAAAYASLGSGRRAAAGDPGDALARALRANGVSAGLSGSDLAARILGLDKLPTVAPSRAAPIRDVTFFEPALDADAPVMVSRLLATLGARDTLIVATLRPPAERVRARIFLGVVAIKGFGWARGTISTPSTRRTGIVTIADVAPTILLSAGENAAESMQGRAAENADETDPADALANLDATYEHAARLRKPLLRGFAWIAIVVLLLSALALRTRASAPRLAVSIALTIVCAAPLAIFAEPLLPGGAVASSIAWTVAVAVVLGSVAFAVLRTSRAVAVISGVTALVVLIDLVLGGPIAVRSPLSYVLAEGSRFYGIGNELMGVVVGATLVAVAFAYDRVEASPAPGALLMTAAVGLMAVPSLGAKLGSMLVAVPAFGLVAARAGGRKPSWRVVGVLEGFAVVSTAVVFLADRLQSPSRRSHIGAVGGAGTSATLARKIGAALRLLALSIWMATLVAAIAAAAIVWRTRRDDVRAVLNLRRHLHAALYGAALAIFGALIFNDAGTIAAAFIAIYLACALLGAVATVDAVRQELTG
jgi:hypothetical protein